MCEQMIEINACHAIRIKGLCPFDDDEGFLLVQYWCQNLEGDFPERWVAVPLDDASRFTAEAVRARMEQLIMPIGGLEDDRYSKYELDPDDFYELELELEPVYVSSWDIHQLRLPI